MEDPRFCTPLGFLEVTVEKHRTKGLVDSGSMINVIPEELARKWGLAMVGSEMKLRGVGGHLTSLVGVVEGCPFGFKGKMEITGVTFCVAKGVKHLILGRPFLMDLEARLEYGETEEVMSYVMGDGRWLKLPLYVPEESSKFQILSRKEEGVRHPKPNMDQGWLYQYNEFLMNVILDGDSVYRQGNIEEEELRLIGKSRNCSWVGLVDHDHDDYDLAPVAHFSNREETGDTIRCVWDNSRQPKNIKPTSLGYRADGAISEENIPRILSTAFVERSASQVTGLAVIRSNAGPSDGEGALRYFVVDMVEAPSKFRRECYETVKIQREVTLDQSAIKGRSGSIEAVNESTDNIICELANEVVVTAINGAGKVFALPMRGMDVADGGRKWELGLRLNTGQSEDWNSTVNAPNGYISFLELMEGMGQRYITCCAAAEDRARLCEFFDGLLKPGGQE
ncbi:hypothetical protein BY996DRAFT_6465094 [Phakopsora pachyrhizi]|nr:hypothetical protein BY996DRAFT_6465094 [Phakopsora pachyrhizi]